MKTEHIQRTSGRLLLIFSFFLHKTIQKTDDMIINHHPSIITSQATVV